MPSPWMPVLKAVAPNANKKFLAAFDAQADAVFSRYGMKSSTAICIMIGQMAHESSGFTRFEENLNYSATRLREVFGKYYPTVALAQAEAKKPRLIANRVYGGRMGNRPGTDDGYDNRGSGAMQHTGESEKQRVARRTEWAPATVMASLRDPAQAWLNMAGGVTYMIDRKVVPAAESGDIDRVSVLINGGRNGLADRRILCNRALAAGRGIKPAAEKTTEEKAATARRTGQAAGTAAGASGIGAGAAGTQTATQQPPTPQAPSSGVPWGVTAALALGVALALGYLAYRQFRKADEHEVAAAKDRAETIDLRANGSDA